MELNLEFNGKLNSEVSLAFNNISYELRGKFNDLVSTVSLPHVDNIDWWVQGPASRNTFSSSLFHCFCCLHLLCFLIKEDELVFSVILVDSKVLKDAVQLILTNSKVTGCRVRCRWRYKNFSKRLVKNNFLVYKLFARKIFQFFVARITCDNSLAGKIPNPITIIDTFTMPGYVENDRWYGCFWDVLSEQQKLEIFFVPTIVLTPLRSMFSVYRALRANREKFLLKEDYLTLSDIFYAFNNKKRIRKIKVPLVTVLGCNFSNIIQDELDNNPDILTVVDAILTYRFIERLKIKSIKIRLAIDWFEGQVIDKAWNMGFKHFYSKVTTIGYRATESFPFYLCSYPLEIERQAGVIPTVIAVQGRGTLNTVNEFLPDLETMLIPSFKSSYVWDKSIRNSKSNEFTILLALPISQYSAVRIINLFCIAVKKFSRKIEVNVIIKPHPTCSIVELKRKVSHKLPHNLIFSDEKSISSLLNISNILVTEASSTCLEAMACGLSVVMMENEEGITYDSIPKSISTILFKKVRTEKQLLSAVEFYIGLSSNELDKQKIESYKVREDYFEPITKEGIDRLLYLDSNMRVSDA